MVVENSYCNDYEGRKSRSLGNMFDVGIEPLKARHYVKS